MHRDIDELILLHVRKAHMFETKEAQMEQEKQTNQLLKKYEERAKNAQVKHIQVMNELADDVREGKSNIKFEKKKR